MGSLLVRTPARLVSSFPNTLYSSTAMPRQRAPQPDRKGKHSGRPAGGGASSRAQPPPLPGSSSCKPPTHKRFFSSFKNRRNQDPNAPRPPTFMTFNVNGLRQASTGAHEEAFWSLLARTQPDFLMLQEHKTPRREKEDPRFAAMGYRSYWDRSERPINQWGCVTFCKEEPVNVLRGEDQTMPRTLAGRLVVLEFKDFVVFNSYAPYAGHSVEGIKNLGRKLDYLRDVDHVLRHVDKQKPVIWGGDINVRLDALSSPLPVIPDHVQTGNYTHDELEAMQGILNPDVKGARRLSDAYAHLHPFTPAVAASPQAWKRFTRRDGFDGQNVLRGQGSRLDTFIVSNRFLSRVQSVRIEHGIYISDHYPVIMTLKTPPK